MLGLIAIVIFVGLLIYYLTSLPFEIGAGFTVAKTGAGSPGKETTKFGPATQAALVSFQKTKKISPATGYYGSKTRTAMKVFSL